RRIVALADGALESVRGEVDDPAEAFATHQLDGVVGHVPRALEVHGDHGIEIVLGHVPDHALAQHASRVDDEIDLAERVRALAHHAAGTGVVSDRVIVGERLAAGLGDFRHHLIGRALGRDLAVAAGAVEAAAWNARKTGIAGDYGLDSQSIFSQLRRPLFSLRRLKSVAALRQRQVQPAGKS